jgi:ParB/RepB/Spo0J family partition protein
MDVEIQPKRISFLRTVNCQKLTNKKEKIADRQYIDIDAIKQLENPSRTAAQPGGSESLMRGIQQHGLLEPIAVWQVSDEYILGWGHRRLMALKKLKWTKLEIGRQIIILDGPMTEREYIVKNAAENVQRKDLMPIELGRTAWFLRNSDPPMSNGEISAQIGLPKSRVEKALQLYEGAPEKYKKHLAYISSGRKKNGKIPPTTMQLVLKHVAGEDNRELILDEVLREEISHADVRVIVLLIQSGMTVQQALGEYKNYKIISADIPVRKDMAEKVEREHNISVNKAILAGLRGQIQLPPNLIFVQNSR